MPPLLPQHLLLPSAAIADAVAAATADAVKDVISGVRTAGVNSLSLSADFAVAAVVTAASAAAINVAADCDVYRGVLYNRILAEGLSSAGEFSSAFSVDPKNIG